MSVSPGVWSHSVWPGVTYESEIFNRCNSLKGWRIPRQYINVSRVNCLLTLSAKLRFQHNRASAQYTYMSQQGRVMSVYPKYISCGEKQKTGKKYTDPGTKFPPPPQYTVTSRRFAAFFRNLANVCGAPCWRQSSSIHTLSVALRPVRRCQQPVSPTDGACRTHCWWRRTCCNIWSTWGCLSAVCHFGLTWHEPGDVASMNARAEVMAILVYLLRLKARRFET